LEAVDLHPNQGGAFAVSIGFGAFKQFRISCYVKRRLRT